MKTVKIGFLGMGNVGSGTYSILKDNAKLIEQREGLRLIRSEEHTSELQSR